MGWPVCNSTLENEPIDEVPLWHGGLTFHDLSILVSGVFAICAACASFYLMVRHATHYSRPLEQRHIIRILLMVPIYSFVAWLSIVFYRNAIYYTLIGNCYEAFAIAAFFSLLCHYIAPDLHAQKDYFRGIKPRNWIWPVTWLKQCTGGDAGIFRTPRSGLTWFNVVWSGVFQYCAIRVFMTIIAVLTQSFADYCQESLSPAFAHVWVLSIEALAVCIAMYCLLQFYLQVRLDIQQYSPFLKILSIKLVIFLSFWQTTVISFLFSANFIHSSPQVHSQDLKNGLPNLLIATEMAIFSMLHLWAYPWRPYALQDGGEVTDFYGNGRTKYQGGSFGIKAFLDAGNPVDLLKAVGRSFKWIFVGHRRRMMDPSYMNVNDASNNVKSADAIPMGRFPGSDTTANCGGANLREGGRSHQYGSRLDEEGEILLANAQANPTTDPVRSGEPGVDTLNGGYETRERQHSESLNSDSMWDAGIHTPRQPTPYNDSVHDSPNPYHAQPI